VAGTVGDAAGRREIRSSGVDGTVHRRREP
jgi:hypothetical protein